MTPDLHELLAVADQAMDAVVEGLARTDRRSLAIDTKSSATDLVTEVDQWSERTIVDIISTARPGDGFVGEEGTNAASSTGVTWVIDPIDGTTNFVYDLPGYGVSIGARVDGTDSVGVVHDPVRHERFRAVLGGGATCNGTPISASDCTDLGKALVATGFSYQAERRRTQAQTLTTVIGEVRDIRRMGGAAVDLCLLACGRVDAYYEFGLNDWDAAAGWVIAREAGAVMGDRHQSGGAHFGASPGIAPQFSELLDRAGAHEA